MTYLKTKVILIFSLDQIEEHESPLQMNLNPNKSQINQEKHNQLAPGDLSDSKINESGSDNNNAAHEMKKVNNVEKAKVALLAPLMRKKHSRSSSHDYSQPAVSNDDELSKHISNNNIQLTVDDDPLKQRI